MALSTEPNSNALVAARPLPSSYKALPTKRAVSLCTLYAPVLSAVVARSCLLVSSVESQVSRALMRAVCCVGVWYTLLTACPLLCPLSGGHLSCLNCTLKVVVSCNFTGAWDIHPSACFL